MHQRPGGDEGAGIPYVSTGHLPTPELVTALVADAHAGYTTGLRRGDGSTSRYHLNKTARCLQNAASSVW